MANYEDFYKMNDTTKLLGQQCITNGTEGDPERVRQLQELMQAAKADPNPQAAFDVLGWHAVDFYSLGVIHGKQAERKRHKQ